MSEKSTVEPPKRMRDHRPIILTGLIISTAFSVFTDAYRIGDAVGILLRTHTPSRGGGIIEAYRHQLPRFGVSTKTRFDLSSLLNDDDIRLSEDTKAGQNKHQAKPNHPPNEHLRLSLSFDEGFHHVPWLDVYNPSQHNEKILQNLEVTIVYSGSDGSIHAVHRDTKYQASSVTKGRSGIGNDNHMPKSFTVEYIWVNEADVDVQGGLLALFLAVLIVSLSGIFGACISSEDEHSISTPAGSKGKRHTAVGSSGGFAKRL